MILLVVGKGLFIVFKRRLIILVLLPVAVRFGGWTGVRCCVLGACAALGRSDGFLGYWAFASLLSCAIASVVSYIGGGGSRGLWVGGVRLCSGSWLWGWISRRPIGALGLVMALSFPFFFYFRALWFGLGLSSDRSFPLRVLFCHNCIFVLHIFNKLIKKQKKRNIFLNQENVRKFFSKQEDLSS